MAEIMVPRAMRGQWKKGPKVKDKNKKFQKYKKYQKCS